MNFYPETKLLDTRKEDTYIFFLDAIVSLLKGDSLFVLPIISFTLLSSVSL